MATFFRRVLGNFYEPAVAPLVVCLATGLSFGVYSSVRSFYHPDVALHHHVVPWEHVDSNTKPMHLIVPHPEKYEQVFQHRHKDEEHMKSAEAPASARPSK